MKDQVINKEIQDMIKESNLGIEIFDNEEDKTDIFRIALDTLQNAFLVTLTYSKVGDSKPIMKSYSLKNKDEVKTFLIHLSEHLI
jgi:hypothetical protein